MTNEDLLNIKERVEFIDIWRGFTKYLWVISECFQKTHGILIEVNRSLIWLSVFNFLVEFQYGPRFRPDPTLGLKGRGTDHLPRCLIRPWSVQVRGLEEPRGTAENEDDRWEVSQVTLTGSRGPRTLEWRVFVSEVETYQLTRCTDCWWR